MPGGAAPAASGSRLAIGPGIDLKGAVISNCDVLAIEGNVEATVFAELHFNSRKPKRSRVRNHC